MRPFTHLIQLVLFAILQFSIFADDRPNIILIIADDIAWDDIGPKGNKNIQAPNIDRLAKEGMWCDRAFLTIASCSPSRSSIISGQYPHNTDAEQLHWPMPGERQTFVKKLREAGYWTGAAGKWHLGEPLKDHFHEVREAQVTYRIPSGATGGYRKDLEGLASGAEEWVPILKDCPKDKPFFLWLASLDAHRPYEEGIIEKPHQPKDVNLPPYLVDIPEIRKDFALYYDEITRFDDYLGQVMDELERQNIADNTLLLFISDNGRPFPRAKVTLYDSGIRTPFYLKWPKAIPAGVKSSSLVSAVDIAPTFLELAGVTPPKNLPGFSFAPLFKNAKTKIRDFAFAEKHWHDFEDEVRAVTNGKFKYIINYYPDLPNTPSADGVRSTVFQNMHQLYKEGKLPQHQTYFFTTPRAKEELYNTVNDPYELKNLAQNPEYAPMLKKMREELSQWQKDTRDFLPSHRTADEFDRWSGTPTPARVRPRASKKDMVDAGKLQSAPTYFYTEK